jgi:hypothetical protein
MEFMESIVKMFDGCVGLLEVLAICLDAAAIYLGVTTYQKHKRVAEKAAHDHRSAPPRKPAWWPVAVVAVFAVVFTILAVFKHMR